MTTDERNERWLQIVLMALSPIAATVLAVSFAWSVHDIALAAPWKLVGFVPAPCPGCAMCGMSRAFTAMSHGDWALALGFNRGVFVLYPAFWALAIAGPIVAWRWQTSRKSQCRPLPS